MTAQEILSLAAKVGDGIMSGDSAFQILVEEALMEVKQNTPAQDLNHVSYGGF